VELETPFPPLDAPRLRAALRANLERFGAAEDPAGWGGLAGLRRYTADLLTRAHAGEARALEELYTFGWGMQAQASLHGELLRTCGTHWEAPELREAGRAVERVADGSTFIGHRGLLGGTLPPLVL
jgi:hypothetical protein